MTDLRLGPGFQRKGVDLIAAKRAPITAVVIHSSNR